MTNDILSFQVLTCSRNIRQHRPLITIGKLHSGKKNGVEVYVYTVVLHQHPDRSKRNFAALTIFSPAEVISVNFPKISVDLSECN